MSHVSTHTESSKVHLPSQDIHKHCERFRLHLVNCVVIAQDGAPVSPTVLVVINPHRIPRGRFVVVTGRGEEEGFEESSRRRGSL